MWSMLILIPDGEHDHQTICRLDSDIVNIYWPIMVAILAMIVHLWWSGMICNHGYCGWIAIPHIVGGLLVIVDWYRLCCHDSPLFTAKNHKQTSIIEQTRRTCSLPFSFCLRLGEEKVTMNIFKDLKGGSQADGLETNVPLTKWISGFSAENRWCQIWPAGKYWKIHENPM